MATSVLKNPKPGREMTLTNKLSLLNYFEFARAYPFSIGPMADVGLSDFYQVILSLRLSPITPATTTIRETIFKALTGSLNQKIPITVIKAVPSPAHIAYEMLTSIPLRARVRKKKLKA